MFSREKNNADKKDEIIEKIICEKYNSYYRMAYSYVHNDEDAADIVQESAYKAIKNSGNLRNIEYASTWIYRIVMNEIYRFLNAGKVISLEETQLEEPHASDSYEDIDLKRAIESMSDDDRAIIQLRYFEDMQLDEIAEILGRNVNTVKSRLYRSLEKLKLKLETD